ncbi:hypothetical protein ACEPAI_1826 [Sanghuangporus weigelae]
MSNGCSVTNHVVLLDGTTHSLTTAPLSHIMQLYKALHKIYERPTDPYRQMLYYRPGIGAGDGLVAKADAALALSFERQVVKTLLFIRSFYRSGDYLNMVGFSRGGAIAQVCVRHIRVLGLPRAVDTERTVFRNVKALIRNGGRSNADFRAIKGCSDYPDLLVTRMILFDPVASSPTVRHSNMMFRRSDACQVICCYAADERRSIFLPVKFAPEALGHDQQVEEDGVTAPDQIRAEFAVFSGGHSDIGGSAGQHNGIQLIPLRYAIVNAHKMEPRFLWKRGYPGLFGLDLRQLSLERVPPIVGRDVDFETAVANDPSLLDLLRGDQMSALAPIKDSHYLKWRVAGL